MFGELSRHIVFHHWQHFTLYSNPLGFYLSKNVALCMALHPLSHQIHTNKYQKKNAISLRLQCFLFCSQSYADLSAGISIFKIVCIWFAFIQSTHKDKYNKKMMHRLLCVLFHRKIIEHIMNYFFPNKLYSPLFILKDNNTNRFTLFRFFSLHISELPTEEGEYCIWISIQ